MCKDCLGNRGDINWADFRLGSDWMRTIFTWETWISHYAGDCDCYDMPGVNAFTLMWDSLHVVEKGTAGHIIGNTLQRIIVQNDAVPGSMHKRCDTIWTEIQKEYDVEGVPTNRRLIKMEVKFFNTEETRNPSDYPQLSGHGIKAAQMRYLVKPILNVARRYTDNSPDYDLMLHCLEGLHGYYEIIHIDNIFLERDEATQLLAHVQQACVCYSALSRRAADRGCRMWNLVPKFHYWWHLARFAQYENPRCHWTYSSEDYVGRISKVAQSIIYGTGVLRVGPKVITKFLRALSVRFSRRKN